MSCVEEGLGNRRPRGGATVGLLYSGQCLIRDVFWVVFSTRILSGILDHWTVFYECRILCGILTRILVGILRLFAVFCQRRILVRILIEYGRILSGILSLLP